MPDSRPSSHTPSLDACARALTQPMIVYALLPLLVSAILVVVFLRLNEPSTISKIIVVIVLAASLIVWWRFPGSLVVAVLLQVGVSLYVLIYLRVNPYAS